MSRCAFFSDNGIFILLKDNFNGQYIFYHKINEITLVIGSSKEVTKAIEINRNRIIYNGKTYKINTVSLPEGNWFSQIDFQTDNGFFLLENGQMTIQEPEKELQVIKFKK